VAIEGGGGHRAVLRRGTGRAEHCQSGHRSDPRQALPAAKYPLAAAFSRRHHDAGAPNRADGRSTHDGERATRRTASRSGQSPGNCFTVQRRERSSPTGQEVHCGRERTKPGLPSEGPVGESVRQGRHRAGPTAPADRESEPTKRGRRSGKQPNALTTPSTTMAAVWPAERAESRPCSFRAFRALGSPDPERAKHRYRTPPSPRSPGIAARSSLSGNRFRRQAFLREARLRAGLTSAGSAAATWSASKPAMISLDRRPRSATS
jgi:hypothetical protein